MELTLDILIREAKHFSEIFQHKIIHLLLALPMVKQLAHM